MSAIHNLVLPSSGSDNGSYAELRHVLPSQIHAITPFVDRIMGFIARFRRVDGSEVDIELALLEALANAVVHGNHEAPYKHVYAVCRCTKEGDVSLMVKDEGKGFDNGRVPDPTALQNRLLTSGRGIHLMKTLMDEIRFEEGGTVVYMRKNSNTNPNAERGSV
jgi:serine/threonine-protein kinase RsbW